MRRLDFVSPVDFTRNRQDQTEFVQKFSGGRRRNFKVGSMCGVL